MELRAMPWHESVIEAELAKTKVLINASSIGNFPADTPVPAELIPPELLVLDLVFSSDETRLMREAKAAGASAVTNGDLMLLHQSARAFELWTGRPAPTDLMREALEAARTDARVGEPPGSAREGAAGGGEATIERAGSGDDTETGAGEAGAATGPVETGAVGRT